MNEPESKNTLNTAPEGAEQAADAPDNAEGITTTTVEELTAQGLNKGVAEAVINMDVAALKKAIDSMIADEIDKRMKANIPKAKQVEDFNNQLKAFEKMGYKERLELSKKNPRLYRELTSRILK